MSIISINGKISSGKDTVGRIIQYLTSEYKDKYDFIEWRDRVENYGSNTYSPFEIKKYAGKLKTIASLLTGIPVEMFEDQEFKKQEMPEEWWYKNVYDAGWDKKWTKETINYPTHTSIESHIVKTTYRQFLQNLGTEAMRDGLHTNVWVNALFADYKDKYEMSTWHPGYEYPNWIITDMRFPNELDAVKERKGITIRVVRPHGYTNPYTGEYKEMPLSYHASETALDDAKFDYEILNDGSIEDLVDKVREILTKSRII